MPIHSCHGAPAPVEAPANGETSPKKSNGKEKNGNGKEGKDDKNGKEDEKDKDDDKDKDHDKPPKALFEWAIGKKHKKNGNGNGNGNGGEEEDRIVTDRPDFTEASVCVGRGRIQLESGYTFTLDRDDGVLIHSHSYPEALFRIGMFADWFELRIAQNFFSDSEREGKRRTSDSGAADLYLGVKLALTEQQSWLPETAVILQMTVPSGAAAFTANEIQPGVNLLYGWDIIPDCLSLGGSTQINRSRNSLEAGLPVVEVGHPISNVSDILQAEHPFVMMAQSLTVGYELTRRLGAYTECFALFPHSAAAPNIGPEYYFDGGFT